VVSGIGFLGAGTILREGITVRGLTTAASLWVVAGVGLAVGAGFFLEAVMTATIVLLALVFLGKPAGGCGV
jgi:putative Mg2+ transporter-C (MgtC) family protein